MAADLVRFGEFELDLGSYQLRRSGRALKLERIPMEVLFLLVERRGQLVTREEIIEKLWGKDVFVDTDNAINTAIRKIRQALKDDPDQPRFVLTVTGRGYRFIGQLSELAAPLVEQAPPALQKPDSSPSTAAAAPGLIISHYRIGEKIASGTSRPTKVATRWKAIALASLILLLLLVGSYFYLRRTSKLTGKRTIVLADFANATGDPVFEDTLRQGLAVQLEQSPFLNLLPEDRMQRTLQLMGRPADSKLRPELAREICERTGADVVLDGSIRSLGTAYVL